MPNLRVAQSLLFTTFLSGFALAGPAFAQQTPAPEQAAPVQDEAVQTAPADQTPATQESTTDSPAADTSERDAEIVVTGSRIASPNIVSLAPIQVVGETEIDQSGAINVQEVLLENPAFGTPGLSRTNSAFLTSGAGVASVDLRDLGSDRTLVLINGRRVVAGLPGSATVDLNIIPTQFVDRIDILTGGASSLYGSDAVAGVVNFLYKRRFEGLLAEGQYGVTSRGDSPRYQVSLTGGGNFADDRGNIMIHLGYTKEGGLLSRERSETRTDEVSQFVLTGEPADYGTPVRPFFSSFVPGGRFTAGDTTFAYDPQTNVLFPCYASNSAPTCVGVNGQAASGPFGFNRQAFRTLAVPVERYLLATRGNFEITSGISAFIEGTYAKTNSAREIEPFALDSSDVIDTGVIPIETLVNGVRVLNPLVPAQIAAAATDLDEDGLRDILFARRLNEVGSRSSESTRDLYRFVVGLEGRILDNFKWDVSYNYGSTTENQTSNGQVNVLTFRSALQAIPDVDDLNNNGLRTDAICADPVARAQGCVPINLFGQGSITPEALRYVNAEGSYNTKITQQVLSANISGSLVELPAGPLGVAVGGEYRRESSLENLDALTNAGLNAGNALPDTSGKFNVKEAFAEVNVPIFNEQPFFHQLNLRAAGRVSDYSTVGRVYTYSLGADWAPIEAIRLRGTYAKATRAPNIGELFTGPSQTFPAGLTDPCTGVTLTGGGELGNRCRASAGVLANINANGGQFTLTQADIQGISGFNSGNPDLDPERSRSITAGVVINPRTIPALRNLVLSADYYNIKVRDSIVAPPRQFILNQCFQQGVSAFCDLITRRATQTGSNSPGSLEFIDAPLVNGGSLKVEGIDFVAAYRVGLGGLLPGFNMNARVAWTHILEAYSIPTPGAPKDPFAGEIGTARDRVNGTIALNNGKVGLSLTGTYIGKSFEDDQFLEQFDLEKDAISIPSQFYLDAQATFTPTRSYELFLGVDNLLDNKAPAILGNTPFNTTGAATAADVYDIFGRRFYAGARLRF